MSTYEVERLAPGYREVKRFNTKAKAIAASAEAGTVTLPDGRVVIPDVSVRRYDSAAPEPGE